MLPLVPGYLSAVSAVEANRLDEPGVARRVVVASLPFVLGFTVVFVVLGAGAAAIGSVLDKRTQTEFAGFLLIVIGLGFVGLLPMAGPRRRHRPARPRARLEHPARRGVRGLRRALHRRRARVDPRARGQRRVDRARRAPARDVLARSRRRVHPRRDRVHARRCATFRWFRDRYRIIQIVGGVTLIALGRSCFFGRYWWLQVALNRVLESVGLDRI